MKTLTWYIKACFVWISPEKFPTIPRSHIPFAISQFQFFAGTRMAGTSSRHPQHSNQYQPPNSGPSRNRLKKEARKAEAPYSYHIIHELSGTANYGPSTGIDSGHPWIDANNNPRIGKVWRTPSMTPLMADCHLTLADKTIQMAQWLRCGIEMYVDFAIHPLFTIYQQLLATAHQPTGALFRWKTRQTSHYVDLFRVQLIECLHHLHTSNQHR